MPKRCRETDCYLYQKLEVPYAGNTSAEIVGVGESPGAEEERRGKPFIGDSGDLIKAVCKQVDLPWFRLFVLNSARCRIDKDKMSKKQINGVLTLCRPKVISAIRQIRPKLIILWGDIALQQVTKKTGITKARGTLVWNEEFEAWCLPTFHPAYILRNPGMRELLVSDMRKAAEFVRNGFKLVTDDRTMKYQEVDDLRDVVKEGDTISIDTETQGKDWMSPNFRMLSVSVSREPGQASNLNLYREAAEGEEPHFTIDWPRMKGKKKEPTRVGVIRYPNFKKRLESIKWVMENPKIKKYMMHGNYDLHAMRWHIRTLRVQGYVMDIQSAANVLDENLFKLPSLEDLQSFFTDIPPGYKQEFDAKFDKEDMLSVPIPDRNGYACFDADVTRNVGVRLREELLKEKKLAQYYVKMSHPTLTHMIFMLEENGAYIDQEALPGVMEDVENDMLTAEKNAISLTPKQVLEDHKSKGIKLTRRELVSDTLFGVRGFHLTPTKVNKKSHAPSSDKESRKLLLSGRIATRPRQYITHFDEWSELHTLWSRYLKGFEKHIKRDMRIHSSYSNAITVTGRLSSRDPNMMNNPKRSKSAVRVRRLIAARKGYLLLAADQEQSELRWAAHVSNAKSMIRVFSRNEDIHVNTAASFLKAQGKQWKDSSKEEQDISRRNAKPVNFGMLYLMQSQGLVTYAKVEYGVDMTTEEAQTYIDIWFGEYPELRVYHEQTIEFGRKHGYVESPLGRRRRLPELVAKDRYVRAEAERMAVNHPIQNPSSDVALMAGNEMGRDGVFNPDFLIAMFIHDELVFEVKDDSKVEDKAKVIKQYMENPPLKRDFNLVMRVPLLSSVKVGPNMASTEKLI
jgi:DNA polymerase-1